MSVSYLGSKSKSYRVPKNQELELSDVKIFSTHQLIDLY